MNQPWVYMCSLSWTPRSPPSHPIPQGHPSAPALSTLSHALNLSWWSVSHMVIYMFQCYSLKSSHPRFLPQSSRVCSLHLCLFCCLKHSHLKVCYIPSTYFMTRGLYFLTAFTHFWMPISLTHPRWYKTPAILEAKQSG